MINLTIYHLGQHLSKLGIKADVHEESHQISFMRTVDHIQVPIFMRVLGEGRLLQIIGFVPVQLKDETAAGLGRLLHMVNKEIDLPGFCMDELSKTVFYRVVATCPEKKCSEELFDSLLSAIDNSIKSFAKPIVAIATGAAKFEDALKIASEQPGK